MPCGYVSVICLASSWTPLYAKVPPEYLTFNRNRLFFANRFFVRQLSLFLASVFLPYSLLVSSFFLSLLFLCISALLPSLSVILSIRSPFISVLLMFDLSDSVLALFSLSRYMYHMVSHAGVFVCIHSDTVPRRLPQRRCSAGLVTFPLADSTPLHS